jgi:hypothetical protein
MSNKYIGDFTPGVVVRFRFNMFSTSFIPTTPTVAPTFCVYKNSTVESTSGITVTVDYDGRAGVVFVAIDTSADPTFYVAGEDYDVMFTAGTVDGNDMARVFVRMFSLENRSRKANVVQIGGQTANAAAAVTFPASVANESTVAARASQTSVDGKPTLAQIEASTVLAKEATVGTRASQASVDGKPTLVQIEASAVLAKESTVGNRPTLAQIEASAVLAKEATVAARASQTSVDGKPTLVQIEASAVLAKEATVTQLDATVQVIKDDTSALVSSVTSVLARIGAFTGTGVNTILGFLRALMRKDGSITTPSDVGGAFVHTTDSLEAIRDRGDAAWTSGGGAGGVTNITVEDRSITLD